MSETRKMLLALKAEHEKILAIMTNLHTEIKMEVEKENGSEEKVEKLLEEMQKYEKIALEGAKTAKQITAQRGVL